MNGLENTAVYGNNIKKEVEKYTITIIDEDEIKNICLNDFRKDVITFGRAEGNDIKLKSLLVSSNHGYFRIDANGIQVVDNNSTNGIFVNNNKYTDCYLNDGDSVKIDNPVEPLKRGIIIILTLGSDVNNWQQIDLNTKEKIVIGRDSTCDIVLNHVSISLQHATISKGIDGFVIGSNSITNDVMINGSLLHGQATLKERDVILIANAKLIYNKGRILYQMYDKGVRLDAIDIVKTVKVKGKKRDISQHVDLSVKPGQFVAFVGGSGAGKSTFMNCISGVSKPTSGSVFVNGNDLFSNYQTLKNIIGYVPQQDIVYTDLILSDMLRYAADLRMPEDTSAEEKQKRIDEVLDIVELSTKKDVMIRNLSGGQRKRASIAVELIADPKLFFLDEPTSGLDPGTERSMMLTLRKMANSGKTIILVTHTTLNLHLCDKVVFFGMGGRLCYSGPPKEALTFFEVDDFVDIYTLLNNDTTTWHEKFNNSPYREKFVPNTEAGPITKSKNKKSFLRQFITLSKRYMKTIVNNKQQLGLLFVQAPIIAFLMSLVVTEDLFTYYDETKMILFGLATASIWLGLLNAIQEICRERVILQKEYMADLKVSAYLGSKFIVLLLLGLIQAILLIGVFSLLVEVPTIGLNYSWYLEMVLVCFLTIISSSSLGLVVSAFAKDTSVAMTIAPLLLVPQLVFSGILFPLEGLVEKISNFILCRWAVEGLGTINDLNSLVTIIQDVVPGYKREVEDFYLFTTEHFNDAIGMIIILMIFFMIICYFILKNQLESDR
ncbi:MAG: ATP-binding cassette domain-containing protein [Bacilli bacterium]|nr:ATP-binding cassette domain-containing protein [Bacilli bacterium]